MKEKKKKAKDSGVTRRQMLKGSVGMGITAGSALLGFPLVYAKDEIVLRYVASGVNAYQEIADQAKKHTRNNRLEIKVHFPILNDSSPS